MFAISDVKNLKKVCVTQRGNRYYFPKTIPRERESLVVVLFLILFVICSVHLYLSDNRTMLPSLYATIILFYLGICLIYRLILFLTELKHSSSRYAEKWHGILKAAFHVTDRVKILFLVSALYFVYNLASNVALTLQDKNLWLAIPFLFVLHRLVDLEDFPINDSLCISKDDGLDYGSGMAYSFFYGYLNYMLSKEGEPNKNLKEMMEDFESINDIKFSVYKIFILIPKSLNCFDSIKNVSNLMDMCLTLPEKKITVAGVRDRVYKNSVYAVKVADKKVFVCAEYATPLKTFKEVYDHTTAHSVYYNRHKNDILLQFYLTLKHILEHNNMHRMCELIFYEDMDAQGRFYDVGNILLYKIKEAQMSEGPKEV